MCLTIIPFRICDNDSCGLHAAKKTATNKFEIKLEIKFEIKNKFVFFTAVIIFFISIIFVNQAKVSVSYVDNKSGPHAARLFGDPL